MGGGSRSARQGIPQPADASPEPPLDHGHVLLADGLLKGCHCVEEKQDLQFVGLDGEDPRGGLDPEMDLVSPVEDGWSQKWGGGRRLNSHDGPDPPGGGEADVPIGATTTAGRSCDLAGRGGGDVRRMSFADSMRRLAEFLTFTTGSFC